MSVRIAIKTLGCKLNFSESATLERRLAECGYTMVPFSAEAELYVINTCAVTEEAGRKSITSMGCGGGSLPPKRC